MSGKEKSISKLRRDVAFLRKMYAEAKTPAKQANVWAKLQKAEGELREALGIKSAATKVAKESLARRRIKATMNGGGSKAPAPDRKAAKRAHDRALRENMKGVSKGAENLSGRSNPKKAAKRARKAAQKRRKR